MYEEFIKVFRTRIHYLFSIFFPGLFILDLFFHKGFFSRTSFDIYSFILLMFWSFIISSPFNFFQFTSIQRMMVHLKKFILIKSPDFKEFEVMRKKIMDENAESVELINSIYHYVGILITLIVLFILKKIFSTYFVYYTIMGISTKFLLFINCYMFLPLIFVFVTKFIRIIEPIFIRKIFNNLVDTDGSDPIFKI